MALEGRHYPSTCTLFGHVAHSTCCTWRRTRRRQQRKRRRSRRQRRRPSRRWTAASCSGRNAAVSVSQRHRATPDSRTSAAAAATAARSSGRCAAPCSRRRAGVITADDADRRRPESGSSSRDGCSDGGHGWRQQHGRRRRHHQQTSKWRHWREIKKDSLRTQISGNSILSYADRFSVPQHMDNSGLKHWIARRNRYWYRRFFVSDPMCLRSKVSVKLLLCTCKKTIMDAYWVLVISAACYSLIISNERLCLSDR